MFARSKLIDRDRAPMWAWFLILPGLVIVTALIVRQMQYRRRLARKRMQPIQEFRLESGGAGQLKRSDVTQTGGREPDSAGLPEPVQRIQVVEAGETAAAISETEHAGTQDEQQAAQMAEQAPIQGDDLKIIEGVGPKIEILLNNAGIYTFRALASASVEELTQVLHKARLHMADPQSWPEQAHLAAEQNWETLKDLQNRIKPHQRSTRG